MFAERIPGGGLGTVERGGRSPAELDGARRFYQFPTLPHCLLLFLLKNSSVPVMHFFNGWPTFSGVQGQLCLLLLSPALSTTSSSWPCPWIPALHNSAPAQKEPVMAHLGCKRAVMQSRARTIPAPGLCRAISLLI